MRFNYFLLFFSLNLPLALWASPKEKLIFAIDLIRHGDRTPVHPIPKVPVHWPEGLGQLTAQGMQQEFQLGKKLREKYIDHYQLLSPCYSQETVYIRSTDYDRAIMSAQSLLLGLYPLGTGPMLAGTNTEALPGAYQPIPIHVRALDQGDALVPDKKSAAFKELLHQYVYSQPDWKKKGEELRPKFAAWSEATGVSIQELDQLGALADSLYVYKLYHKPLPENLSAKEIDSIIETGRWLMATKFKPKEIGKAFGGELLSTISHYLQAASEQKNKLKYVLLSGHDSSILVLMSALHVPLDVNPPYASIVSFALFEEGFGKHSVEVSFNERLMTIPGCKGPRCSLEEFLALHQG